MQQESIEQVPVVLLKDVDTGFYLQIMLTEENAKLFSQQLSDIIIKQNKETGLFPQASVGNGFMVTLNSRGSEELSGTNFKPWFTKDEVINES